MKCYILGAVSGGLENAEQIFNVYKKALENKFQILGTPLETAKFEGSLDERFVRAKTAVENADVIIADMSVASTGAGIELGMAHLLHKKIVCFVKKSSKVSGLVIGMVGKQNVIYYENENDLFEKLSSFDFSNKV